jgi:mannose-6-phosphate isomerase-like protein (cupin superfamily)
MPAARRIERMTYPEPRYHGERGEASATYRPTAHEPDLVYANGTSVHYLANGASTDGQFGLYRWEMGPDPSGPGPHFHRSIAESFYVLAGTVRIYDGREWLETQTGDFVHVPPGGIHGFRNESAAPAAMLIHFAPGAPREGYFEGLARFAVTWRPGEDELADFYRRHDNIWL